ncbi:unnamed protein product, partial [Prorocentrum cordatum]
IWSSPHQHRATARCSAFSSPGGRFQAPGPRSISSGWHAVAWEEVEVPRGPGRKTHASFEETGLAWVSWRSSRNARGRGAALRPRRAVSPLCCSRWPAPMGDDRLATEVYSFSSFLASLVALAGWLVWVSVPDDVLVSWGITYYPDKWWVLAVPTYIVTLGAFITVRTSPRT